MKSKKVTFADIAAYTNFSKTTISRYFNDPDSLTLENQQKIADALVALDYKENKVGTDPGQRQNRIRRRDRPQSLYALLFRNAQPASGHL